MIDRVTRSPSSALLPFFGGGFPYSNKLQKKVGTLILTSLLEDLVRCPLVSGFVFDF